MSRGDGQGRGSLVKDTMLGACGWGRLSPATTLQLEPCNHHQGRTCSGTLLAQHVRFSEDRRSLVENAHSLRSPRASLRLIHARCFE